MSKYSDGMTLRSRAKHFGFADVGFADVGFADVGFADVGSPDFSSLGIDLTYLDLRCLFAVREHLEAIGDLWYLFEGVADFVSRAGRKAPRGTTKNGDFNPGAGTRYVKC